MKRLFFPAIFEIEKDGGYSIFFPDIAGCNTCADNIDNGYEMAFDCLGLTLSYMEDNKEHIPTPSNPSDIQLEPNQFLVVIEFDMLAYKKKNNSSAVKKTLTIPAWLNEDATALGINFSQTLQEALIQKIDNKKSLQLK